MIEEEEEEEKGEEEEDEEDEEDDGGGGGGEHLNNNLILCKLLETAEPEVEPLERIINYRGSKILWLFRKYLVLCHSYRSRS